MSFDPATQCDCSPLDAAAKTSAQQRLQCLLVHLMHFDNITGGIVEENLVPLVHE